METNRILLVLAVCVTVLCCNQSSTGDDGGTDPATCAITITVDSIVEWEGSNPQGTAEPMPAIALANITDQASAPEGTSTLTLFTNSNVAISADNTDDSQLTHTDGTVDTLVTKYKLATDGAGAVATGATGAAVTAAAASTWTVHSSFLTPTALAITHVNTDGAVE
ncbi:MAG TPA: hypothetical protein DCP47_04540, partial [Phycisphaerales bacterium]|nr:hypothetical protein [Phycisphaerales bacterium]